MKNQKQGHHHKWVDFGDHEFTQDYPVVFLNTIIYAASTASDGNKFLTIDRDYSRVSCMVTRFENE